LRYLQANYQQLPEADNQFGGVLAVETLCQTADMQCALREAHRVLVPGGRLVVVDCFRSEPLESFDAPLQQAALLVEKATAVDSFSVFEQWCGLCESIGFARVATVDHSAETAQNLARLHRLATKFFGLPRAVQSLGRVFPQRLLENAACGLMMPYTVGAGVHVYCSAVFQK
jgi:ubiquinone/menaquinone biosynthesis C-methylase UbiE